jgi:hypothetical protein
VVFAKCNWNVQVENDEMGGACSMKGGKEERIYVISGKARWKETLGRPRRRWVDNIRMDLAEVEWGDVDWIGLVQDRNRWRALVNLVMNLGVP